MKLTLPISDVLNPLMLVQGYVKAACDTQLPDSLKHDSPEVYSQYVFMARVSLDRLQR